MVVYTSYLAKLKNIDADIIPVFIFRYAPPSLKTGAGIHLPELAPMAATLRDYKAGTITMSTLKDTYLGYLYNNRESIIRLVNSKLIRHQEICLICYEKDVESCHREVLAKFLEENGFEYGGEI